MSRSQRKNLRVAQNMENHQDRLSNLPEVLLTVILSLLPTKDAVATSVLSTKWEYMWTTVTKLHFDDTVTYYERGKKKATFITFVDRLLFFCNPNMIHDFHLTCTYKYTASRIHAWISAAIRLNPSKIHIVCHYTRALVFPTSLYTCDSLTELNLHMHCTLKVPTSVCFSNLKILHLLGVKILIQDFPASTELNFSFPVLELLCLRRIHLQTVKVINIDAPKLRKLKMSKYGMVDDCVIKINAPSLTEVESSVFVDFIMLSPPSVISATIEFFTASFDHQLLKIGLLTCTFLRQLCSLKCLTLPAKAIEALKHVNDLQDHLPTLGNLIHLTITWGIPVHVGTFVTLLNKLPFLETLIFTEECFSLHNNEVVQMEPLCSHPHLKVVLFMNFGWTKLELQLAMFLLMNAIVLENMTIIYEGLPSRKFETLKKQLLSFPKSSNRASIVFQG